MLCTRCEHKNEQITQDCPVCGWEFSYYLGDLSPEDQEQVRIKITIARTVWLAHQKDELSIKHLLNFLDDSRKSEAIEWVKKDAERGIAAAQYMLGEAYDYGYGVERDVEMAWAWFKKSAAQNYIKSFNKINNTVGAQIDNSENIIDKLPSYPRLEIIEPNPVYPGQLISISLQLPNTLFYRESSVKKMSVLAGCNSIPIPISECGGYCGTERDVEKNIDFIFPEKFLPEIIGQDYVTLVFDIFSFFDENHILTLQPTEKIYISNRPSQPKISSPICFDSVPAEFNKPYSSSPSMTIVDASCFGIAGNSGNNYIYIKQNGAEEKVDAIAMKEHGWSSGGGIIYFKLPQWISEGRIELSIQSVFRGGLTSERSDPVEGLLTINDGRWEFHDDKYND